MAETSERGWRDCVFYLEASIVAFRKLSEAGAAGCLPLFLPSKAAARSPAETQQAGPAGAGTVVSESNYASGLLLGLRKRQRHPLLISVKERDLEWVAFTKLQRFTQFFLIFKLGDMYKSRDPFFD